MVIEKELTIVDAWREIKNIEVWIKHFEDKIDSSTDIRPVNLKKILTSGGKFNNDPVLNIVISNSSYDNKLIALRKSKAEYEKIIWDLIELNKNNKQGVIIAFLKEQKRMKWDKIADIMYYSEKQCRRFYSEYKGKTPQNNTFYKDDQKCPKI